MPVYEYICKECGNHFDKLRSMSQADEPIACSKCNSLATQRMLSRFYASSDGKAIASQGSSCGGCSGGSCSSCGSNNN